jgi:hypothetical protein
MSFSLLICLDQPVDLMDSGVDINAVASLLKLYLRNLPTPLFPSDMYDEFMQAMEVGEDYDTRLIIIKTLVQRIPKHLSNVLECLMRHLARVADRSDENLMAAENLGIVFGPSLVLGGDEGSFVQNLGLHNALVGDMIMQVDWIFDGNPN